MKPNIEKMIYATLDEVLNDLNLDNPEKKILILNSTVDPVFLTL